MNINFPPKVRISLYILVVIGGPIITYLLAKGFIGELEMGLWAGLTSAVSALAAFNIAK